METRFRTLRFISMAYKVFGVIALAISILTAIGALGVSSYYTGGYGSNIVGSVLAVVPGVIIAVSLFGAGELIEVLLYTEENTRTSLEYDDQMVKLMKRMIQEQVALREAITNTSKTGQSPTPPQP